MAFSSKIDKILLALGNSPRQELLVARLCQLAPDASIRCSNTLSETLVCLEHWHPVLAVIDFSLGDGRIVSVLKRGDLQYRVPFIVGIAQDSSCEEVASAMRWGVSYVLDATADEQRFESVLTNIVLEPASLEQCVSCMVNPLLYADGEQLNLKKLSEQFEHYIFTSASHVATSKNGLARLLGISRQLLQYHLKKKESARLN